jgi:hypothetical protein
VREHQQAAGNVRAPAPRGVGLKVGAQGVVGDGAACGVWRARRGRGVRCVCAGACGGTRTREQRPGCSVSALRLEGAAARPRHTRHACTQHNTTQCHTPSHRLG